MKLAFFTLLAVLILVKYTSAEGFEYYEQEEDSEELLCSSNEECLEMNSNKPICRENNCQPECTPLEPCPTGQSCVDGKCNIESNIQDQPTIINKVIQVNPVDLPIVKKIPLEKDTPQGSKHRGDRNFKEETSTEPGEYYHTDYSNYDDYIDEGTDYYNDEETSKGSDGNNSYNFFQFCKTDIFQTITSQSICCCLMSFQIAFLNNQLYWHYAVLTLIKRNHLKEKRKNNN